jgi:hypothetical protein
MSKLSYNVIFKEIPSTTNLVSVDSSLAGVVPMFVTSTTHATRIQRYELTKEQVQLLENNPLIKSVEPTLDRLPAVPEDDWIQTARFYRSSDSFSSQVGHPDTNPNNKNWALLRCTEGVNRANWGKTGFTGHFTGTEIQLQLGTIDVTSSGKHIDIVIIDSGHVPSNFYEFQKNPDGTGGTRVVEYNWNQHLPELIGESGPPTDYGADKVGEHGTIVASFAAGNTQGWARDANIYTFSYLYDWHENVASPVSYIRAFHRNKPINPATGRKNPTIVNNSWSYRFTDSRVKDHVGELWDQDGTRLLSGSLAPENVSNFYSGVTSRYRSGSQYTSNQLTPLFLNDQSFDNSSAAENSKYIISSNNDLTGNRILSLPDPSTWPVAPYHKSWYKEQYSIISSWTPITNDAVVTIQGPATLTVAGSQGIKDASGSWRGTIQTEFKIFKGSQLINTSYGTLVTHSSVPTMQVDSFAGFEIRLPDNAVYELRYKSIINTTSPQDQSQSTSRRFTKLWVTNPQVSCSKTPNFFGEAQNIPRTFPGDGLGGNISPPFDITWVGFVCDQISFPRAGMLDLSLKGDTDYLSSTSHRIFFNKTSYINDLLEGYSGPNDYFTYSTSTVTGSTGSRVYTVSINCNSIYNEMYWKPAQKETQILYRFRENSPNTVEVEIGKNQPFVKPAGTYALETFRDLGWRSSGLQMYIESVAVDHIEAMEEGIICIGSAGNNGNTMPVQGDPTYNNKFLYTNTGTIDIPGYYKIGQEVTPGGAGGPDRALAIGAIENSSLDRLAYFSTRGSLVDLSAPGSGLYFGSSPSSVSAVVDPRNPPGTPTQFLKVANGTSFSSPNVCGVAALILEHFPYFTQKELKEYLLKTAGVNQINEFQYGDNLGGKWNDWLLKGTKNNYLKYKKERRSDGQVTPTPTRSFRPVTGAVYPRRRPGIK